MKTEKEIELLAPARDAATAIEAIRHGADAVYIGAAKHGARAAAGNSVADIARVCDFAHRFGARVYVTVNTLVLDDEIAGVEALIADLYAAGVDALIVQDMGVTEMKIPPIELHASTQCDIRTPERARFLADAGFTQLVVARELSLEQTRAVAEAVPDASIEAFVHGALCVSYSGDCQAGWALARRSANRGECPQMCRLPYRLQDAAGRDLAPERHYLSLRDMQRIDRLADMADAGISSFKIEGRLKDAAYVRSTVAAYSAALDRVAGAAGGRYVRGSAGSSRPDFEPRPDKVFNRGYTSYFLDTPRRAPGKIASMASPKNTGRRVGTVQAVRGRTLSARLDEELHNGDGLGFFGSDGRFTGFRANKVEGPLIHTTAALPQVAPGTPLFRNADKAYNDAVDAAAPERTIAVDMQLRAVDDARIALRMRDERGNDVELCAESPATPARSDQHEARRRTLAKLGGTIYRLSSLDDSLADRFVPASQLAALRRDALDRLDSAQRARYAYDRRRPCRLEDGDMKGLVTTYHDNIANRLAESVYRRAGANIVGRAVEVSPTRGETVVMTTRYCLRRELGACLRGANAAALPADLRLRAPGIDYRLSFDCERCEMHVTACR